MIIDLRSDTKYDETIIDENVIERRKRRK